MAETHAYPGVNLPLRFLCQEGEAGVDFYRLGSSEQLKGSTSPMLQVREVAMMILMDRLTDKPNWHEKVFNEEIVAKWRHEALTQDEAGLYQRILGGKNIPMPRRARIVSEKAFDYCIAELRCKAAIFEKRGLTFTINSGENTAIKSDTVVSDELREGLRAAFVKLQADQAAEPDWHPGTNDTVQDLVHPSMHPFIYGKSKFIQGEVVGVADAIDKWSGKGEIVPKDKQIVMEYPWPHGEDEDRGEDVDKRYWSDTFQWLPANLAFQEDGTVKFTSYVNSLHPKKYPEIYTLLEKVIDTAIPAWDRVLSGRPTPTRFDLPPEVYDDSDPNEVWEKVNPELIAAYEAANGPIDYDDDELEWFYDNEEIKALESEEAKKEMRILQLKWKELRDPLFPEPVAFREAKFRVKQKLCERFKDTGLQVIVKMASVELTPEKPDFPVGGWHIEGQMNEHIVATALYYLDSENVTPSHLSFRMRTSTEQDELSYRTGQDMWGVYEHFYGTRLRDSDSESVQPYGDVETREGRLLAFPNVFQHRVSSFSLQDRTKPGHRRFIALWLVDPFRRVISTANVPPQQLDWWSEAVFGGGSSGSSSSTAPAKGEMPPELFQLLLEQGAAKTVKPPQEMLSKLANRLPAEVMDMVRKERVVPEGLMTREEACHYRLELMAERSVALSANEQEWKEEYFFCEH